MTGRSSTTPPGNRPEGGPETTAPVPPTAAPARAERPAQRRPGGGPRRRLILRPRVVLGGLLLVVFVGVLVVQAYINSEFTSDHLDSEVGDQSEVPVSIRGGGPVVNTTGGQESTSRMPYMTIALTFDDGPDPTWTPKVLQVLKEYQVTGTFFVVGSEVARHPELAEQLVDAGNELGVHTFTHPNLQRIAPWRRTLEINETQNVIAKATGVHTNLVRFPYSSKTQAIDNVNWKIVKEVGRQGYLMVVNDVDSEDWQRPGVQRIVRNALPAADSPTVVLFHDAGGNRAETVAALREYIPMMQSRGFRFTTITGGLNHSIDLRNSKIEEKNRTAKTPAPLVPRLPENPPAAKGDVWRGAAVIWTVRVADRLVWVVAGLFLVVGSLTLGRTALLLLLASRHARQRRKKTWSWGPPVTEPVSVIVPAYNEKEGIEAAVRSLAGGDYPAIEVVVVDDGSTDGTAALVEALGLRNVRVIRVPNGGKANALNTGIALAKNSLIVTVDGDTIFEPESIRMLVQPFADPRVGAVAGNVKVGNREKMVAAWQHIEYVIGFNLDRRLYEIMGCMPTVPGAIGAFRREALSQVGGISDETLAEDTDVTMAMCRAGWRVVYEERAKAWTEAPATLEQLYKQRYRWSYGTMQAMWKHRRSLFDKGPSGRFGRVGLPFLALFGIALPLLAPVVDILLVYGLVFWELQETVIAWLGMLAVQLFTAAVAFRFDRESSKPLWRLPLQQFAYRQLMYLVLLQSATTALTGGRLRWHKLHRAGLAPRTIAAPPARPALDSQPVAAPVFASPPVPAQGVAPEIDTWPPTLDQARAAVRHPAAGRAVARPAVPTQHRAGDPEDLPSAGSPPGGGSGPAYTG
jgi:cellulose synthase/poly-beta-1,6-N-acetylglucosamine synthase-like glycosyltransferase/peptidoglycan/xylan/chitin deacetylase (PgdA/CDA1 family)